MMIETLNQWAQNTRCPVCLGALTADDDRLLLACSGCGGAYPVTDNIPVFTGRDAAVMGVKESTELEAQLEEHRGSYLATDTNEGVKGRVASLLAKHGVATDATSAILEIGCGPFESLHDAVAGVKVGVDLLATSYGRHLPFQRTQSNIMEAFAEVLPFPDRFFDVIVTRNSFDHLNDPELALKELNRTLKRGGHLILECYLDSNPFVSHEPFVLTDRFIEQCVSRYFHTVTRRRLKRPEGFAFDWVELLLTPVDIAASHRPFAGNIFKSVAESYLELYARGFALTAEGKYGEAIVLLERSVAENEEHFWNELWLLDAGIKKRDLDYATPLLRRIDKKIAQGRYPYVESPGRTLHQLLERNRAQGFLA